MILLICGDITKNLLNKNVTTFVQKKKNCFLHEELQKLTDYVDWIRDRNLNENIIVTKIALFLKKTPPEEKPSGGIIKNYGMKSTFLTT